MDSRYSTTESKIWLAVHSSQAAKSLAVTEQGIGEEIPLTLFGWVDDHLSVICQTTGDSKDKNERFSAITTTAHVLRRAWGCDSYTFIAEGFCAIDPTVVDTRSSLAQQFADGNEGVAECLTFMHLDPVLIHIFTTPYRYGIGRTVTFGSLRPYPHDDDNAYKFPRVLQNSFTHEVEETPEAAKTFYDTISIGLLKIGVSCKWWDVKTKNKSRDNG